MHGPVAWLHRNVRLLCCNEWADIWRSDRESCRSIGHRAISAMHNDSPRALTSQGDTGDRIMSDNPAIDLAEPRRKAETWVNGYTATAVTAVLATTPIPGAATAVAV